MSVLGPASFRTGPHGPGAEAMHDLLDAAAAASPSMPAVRDDGGSLTYAELARASRRLAQWLADSGVKRGDRVLVRHRNAVSVVVLLYAVSRISAVLVPVSPALSRFQLLSVLSDAEPVLVLGSVEAGASEAGDELTWLRAQSRAYTAPLSAALDESRGCVEWRGPGPRSTDLALLMYTSGSTSAPKGVMCPHRAVVYAARAIAARLQYRPEDRVFCRVPLSFDYGLYQTLLCAVAGGELQLVPEGQDAVLLRSILTWGATIVPVVPSLATMLIALVSRRGAPAAPRIRLFTNTGATLTAETAAALRAAFPGAAVCAMYGITECKRVSVMEPDGDLERPGSSGRPLDGTTVTVVDEENRALPPGLQGEFVVRGPHVMAGYWRAPEQTGQRFTPQPRGEYELRTGDFGKVDADGYLYFTGRRDDMFKRKGIRVSTTEVEAAAHDIDGVIAAAALVPDSGHGLLLFAETSHVTAEQILTGLRDRLEQAKVPDACRILDRLPLTPNGKIDRAELARLREPGVQPQWTR
ncbi:class I adenylate-forming enzyme family protein [Streptomyces microflavus]|uniref:class I adenylate-forming enzyme family protein n=1 Tax=Streptomyces microflavus TaxID=1919 RepID=UPI00345327DC